MVADHGSAHNATSGENQPPAGRRSGIPGDDDLALWPGFLLADSSQLEAESLDDGGGAAAVIRSSPPSALIAAISACLTATGHRPQNPAVVLGDIAGRQFAGNAGLHAVINGSPRG